MATNRTGHRLFSLLPDPDDQQPANDGRGMDVSRAADFFRIHWAVYAYPETEAAHRVYAAGRQGALYAGMSFGTKNTLPCPSGDFVFHVFDDLTGFRSRLREHKSDLAMETPPRTLESRTI
ncbi:unnamed protein product [Nippostrongylus brasiliensis]|uniref:RES domain-containing protein n=1 Tax=Nippostrongylus brasiliensis TaxID=27835 RepID=A0A0N4XSQ1_NIPBR|nr:unnamed protein product [Nippostrongylus brasiliensis]